MPTTLQIVSPLDQTTVLFDLNDYTATNATSLVPYTRTEVFSDVDLGVPALDTNQVQPAQLDTLLTTFARHAAAPVRMGIHITASSVDNLTKVVGTLAQYLAQGCVMKWVPTGATQTAYLDVLPSLTPVILNGQALGLQQLALFMDTQNDLKIEFTRQAYLRFGKLDPALNRLVTNPTMLRDSDQDGLPNGWTKTSTPTVSIVTATESCRNVAASAGLGIFQASAAASFTSGDPGTVSVDVKVASGTVAVILDWRTAADATISNTTVTTTSAGWTRVSASGTAPGTTDHVRFRIESSGAAATWDMRNAQIEKTASASPFRVCPETIFSDPATAGFAKGMLVYNPSTAPAPLETTISFPDASTAVQQISFNLLSSDLMPGNDYLVDFVNGPYYGQAEANGNGWTLTAGTDTTLAGAVDALASPGSGTSVARITHATAVNYPTMRIRWSRTTLLDCLRGSFAVFVRMKPTITANSSYDVSIKWGTGGTVQNSNEIYTLDNTASTGAAYRLLYLGNIVLPEDSTSPAISSLQIELWSNMTGVLTAQNLDVDYIGLCPTEDVAVATVSGNNTDTTTGSTLGVPKQLGAPVSDPVWTAGTVSGTVMTLIASNAGAAWGGTGIAGNTGFFTGVGGTQHTVSATMSFVSPTNITAKFQLIYFDVGGLNPVVAATTTKGPISSPQAWTPTLSVADVAGKLYQLRVVVTGFSSGGLFVSTLTHITTPIIIQNQKARFDPGSVPPRYSAEQLDSSGNIIVTMNASKVPFWIPPGLSLVQMRFWDKKADSNDLELSHLNARTVSVSPAVYPRSWV
jgi:hypothetical protein